MGKLARLAAFLVLGVKGLGAVFNIRAKTASRVFGFSDFGAAMVSPLEPSPVPIITIPDDYLLAIGKVNIVWGVLESIIELSIIKLAGFAGGDQRGAIMTAHMTWPLKMDILESFTVALQPTYLHLAKFTEIKPLLDKASKGRGRVAHGIWGYENGTVTKGRATARGKLKISFDTITVADLDAICLDIHRAGVAVIMLVLQKH